MASNGTNAGNYETYLPLRIDDCLHSSADGLIVGFTDLCNHVFDELLQLM